MTNKRAVVTLKELANLLAAIEYLDERVPKEKRLGPIAILAIRDLAIRNGISLEREL